MRLLPLWDADLQKAYELQMSFLPDENGFTNPVHGKTLEEFSQYVQEKKRHNRGQDLPEGFVPDTVFVLVDDQGEYVGIFNLRHCLNDALRNGAGHIGYGIRKEFRGRGYASAGLALALEEARKIVPEDEIYFSVHLDNPASLKVQLKNGARIDHQDDKEYYTRIPK
ncbi:MAG: GNAT family N-acetyltransferase [Acutalibacter sp.]